MRRDLQGRAPHGHEVRRGHRPCRRRGVIARRRHSAWRPEQRQRGVTRSRMPDRPRVSTGVDHQAVSGSPSAAWPDGSAASASLLPRALAAEHAHPGRWSRHAVRLLTAARPGSRAAALRPPPCRRLSARDRPSASKLFMAGPAPRVPACRRPVQCSLRQQRLHPGRWAEHGGSRNCAAMSPASSRSRFLENAVERSHAAIIDRRGRLNQQEQQVVARAARSTRRSERTESNACSSMRPQQLLGRDRRPPERRVRRARSPERSANAASTIGSTRAVDGPAPPAARSSASQQPGPRSEHRHRALRIPHLRGVPLPIYQISPSWRSFFRSLLGWRRAAARHGG